MQHDRFAGWGRKGFRQIVLSLILLVCGGRGLVAAPPNVVLIFADDLGYADLGSYGAKQWKTPNLDRLAREGVRFTDFHSSQPVCSASRASLLTGCYANRLGIHGALGPQATHGLAAAEMTLAEVLQTRGYATAMVGKWHLGHHPQFLPPRHGFDRYFGLPYSNDMWPHRPDMPKANYPKLPLIEGIQIVDDDVTAEDQARLTEQYTQRCLGFLREQTAERPFFLYYAQTFPHVPLFVGERFRGRSPAGIYGDCLEEIDDSVGQIMTVLEQKGFSANTLVIFTSDNGPWLNYGNHAGSAGLLREGKGTSYEGGHRVPCVARYPGVIPAGQVQSQTAMTIDLLPTIAAWAGADLPPRPIDGRDIRPLFQVEPGAKCPHPAFAHYYQTNELQAVRMGPWKLMLPHTSRTMRGQVPGKDGRPGRYVPESVELALYHLEQDLGETKNVITEHPEVLAKILEHVETFRAELGDSLTKRVGRGVRPPDRLPAKKP